MQASSVLPTPFFWVKEHTCWTLTSGKEVEKLDCCFAFWRCFFPCQIFLLAPCPSDLAVRTQHFISWQRQTLTFKIRHFSCAICQADVFGSASDDPLMPGNPEEFPCYSAIWANVMTSKVLLASSTHASHKNVGCTIFPLDLPSFQTNFLGLFPEKRVLMQNYVTGSRIFYYCPIESRFIFVSLNTASIQGSV